MFNLEEAKKKYPHFYHYNSFYDFATWMAKFENGGEMTLYEALNFVFEKELKSFLYGLEFYKIVKLANNIGEELTANIINKLVEYITQCNFIDSVILGIPLTEFINNKIKDKDVELFVEEFENFRRVLLDDLNRPNKLLKELAKK